MTLKQKIEQLRKLIAAKLVERNAVHTELEELRAAATTDQAAVDAAVTKKRGIDTELELQRDELADLEQELARDEAAQNLAQQVNPGAAPGSTGRAYDQVARVGAEERTYAAHKERGFDQATGTFHRGQGGTPPMVGGAFARDVAAAFLGNYEAQARLQQHMAEERVERAEYLERAVGTGAFAGLTVPQYLTDLYAPATAAGRPFANVCRQIPLPSEGMTVNISRVTTSTSAAAQATENTAVSETNADDTLLTENVLTVGGQQTLSRQAVDRSTGAEAVIMDDLFRRYATALDSKLINDATTGLDAVAQQVAYTDGTPTAAELYPKLLNAQANLEAVYLDSGVTREIAIMHSRRWAWLQSQVGPNWPFIGQPGIPTQAGGVNYATEYGSGVRGVLPNGMPVIVDNNISTAAGAGTEDRIYIVNADECFLWEDPNAPMFIRAEQPAAASLGVLLVVFGYFAYTHRRYTNGQQLVQGTGLIAPTF